MALSAGLERAGHARTSIETSARSISSALTARFRISRIDLSTTVDVPGIDDAAFRDQAETARRTAPSPRRSRASTFKLDAPAAADLGNTVDLRLELVLLPVSDVDRAKAFYVEKVGFNLDVDVKPGGELRIVQMTPPGSTCSITIGTGITDAAPGSVRGTHLVTPDIEVARAELAERGVDVSEVFQFEPGGQRPGPDPSGQVQLIRGFSDPESNTWLVQEA
jgi:catechol 2,3-dioxygenase-like lactoylglutathione lyase family enzyme